MIYRFIDKIKKYCYNSDKRFGKLRLENFVESEEAENLSPRLFLCLKFIMAKFFTWLFFVENTSTTI